ncbi:MAG: helix-turn-helix transcriptional regulator [Alphaproteobacteria bacterium]|nr:helix-turn-helix transcriptional regulator [Alphaproteobacteria bacterium]
MLARRKSSVDVPPPQCPLSECLAVIGGQWTPNIIWHLSGGPRRFSELKDDVVGISSKMLTVRLKKLEAEGIVHREVMPTSPPTVEYSLTELGQELKPAIEAIVDVGHRLKLWRQGKGKA